MANNESDETLEEVIGDDNVIVNDDNVTGSPRFITRVFHENNNQVIGAEVIVYDDNQNRIDSIVIADKTSLDQFQENWENISKYYVLRGDVELPEDLQDRIDTGELTLQDIIKNSNGETPINATTLNENFTYESFALKEHDHDNQYATLQHQSDNEMYGVGTNNLFGHVKIADNLDDSTFKQGTALSSHQGYELNQKINDVNSKNKWSSTIEIGSYIKYRVNPDLRLVVFNYNRNDYTGLKKKTGSHTIHGENTIPLNYQPSSRSITSLYRGDVTLYVNTDGSVELYNLTLFDKINIHAQLIWHF